MPNLRVLRIPIRFYDGWAQAIVGDLAVKLGVEISESGEKTLEFTNVKVLSLSAPDFVTRISHAPGLESVLDLSSFPSIT